MILVPLLLIASALAQTAPPVGTWAQLPNTQLYPAIPFEAKRESASSGTPELWSPRGVFAFSGADVAQINGVWGFLIWGGGHGDSPDNSLYWNPFDGSGAKRLTGPYLAPDKVYYYDAPLETYRSVSRNAPPTVTVAAAPKSRHTYSSLLRIDLRGQPAVFNYGGSLAVRSGSGTAATRIFDLSQTYDQAMARPDMGWALKAPGPGSAVSSSSGWDPVQKRVVTRSRGFIGAYYPETDRWENWNIQNAPFGSDFQASVAMDVIGRKMYVLGDRLAEVMDLDSKAYTDLRGKPWVAAFPGVGGGTGYLAGPGVSWHARTKQIVAWVGGNNLLLINPATDTIKSITMGGATVTAAPSAGTYGRFRVIPGTDQVVLVNAVDQNVFIGTVPFDGGTPVPPPQRTPMPTPLSRTITVPPGQPLPTRTWVERPMPTGPIQSYMQRGGKHGRAIYHPGLKSMVFAGGDWHPTMLQGSGDGVGSEIWALDVTNNQWKLLRPLCVPGETQPGHPDNVVWAFDSKRNRGLMAPGFYAITQGAASTCGSINGYGAYAFDFVTRQFTGPNAAAGLPSPPQGWGGDNHGPFGWYDPITDELGRVRSGPILERLNLATQTWRTQNLTDPGGTTPHRSQQVIDVKGRAIYLLIQFHKPSALMGVRLTDGAVRVIPLPLQYTPPGGTDQEVYTVFDPINRIVLVPNNTLMGQAPLRGLGIYHVDTGQWEWEPVPASVMGSVWGFDEATGAMIGIGKRSQPYAYFLYKYSATPQPTR